MPTDNSPEVEITLEVRVVGAFLETIFDQRAAAFRKDTASGNYRELEEIMGALQAWRHKTTASRSSRADYLYHNKVIGSWVGLLHADHLGKTSE